MMKQTIHTNIPDQSSPGLTRAAPTVLHQGRGAKFTTDEQNLKMKIRARDNLYIGTWNVRTLYQGGKLEELVYEINRYRWNIIGLSEVRWTGIGEKNTSEGHKLYFS